MTGNGLTIDERVKILNDVVFPLRAAQLLGILEARRWVEVLFPEFGEIRDREMDAFLEDLASGGPEQDVHSTE